MRLWLAVLFVATSSLFIPAAAAPPIGDISDLVGEWRYVAMTSKGKTIAPEEVKNYRLLIAKDGTMSVYDGENQVAAGRITKVKADKKPKQIDCVIAGRNEFSGRFAPEYTQEGIFEVSKKKLKVCLSRNAKDGPRPTEFVSPKDKDLVLEEFERIK